MSFTQRFLKNTKTLLTDPTPQQGERLEFAQTFLKWFQLLVRVVAIRGYARDLDYDQIDPEELIWVGKQIGELPTSDSDYEDYTFGDDRVLLRDQVARSLFVDDLTLDKILAIPAKRVLEEYF